MKLKRGLPLYFIFSVFLIGITGLDTQAAQEERKVIISPTANIRSGPGTNFEVLWKVEKYFPVIIIRKKGNWCQFRDFEKDEGWIHMSLLGNIPGVVAIKDGSNIRSGPGNKYDILFTAERGVPFRELKRKGNWVQVMYVDGDRGWIHKSLLW